MIDDIVCRIIGHRRSRRQAHRVDGAWLSRCKRCGVKLVRLRHAEWREPESILSGMEERRDAAQAGTRNPAAVA